MWIWNDYLLPLLVLDQTKYKTIPLAIQYLKGGYGSIDMGCDDGDADAGDYSDHHILYFLSEIHYQGRRGGRS